MTSNKRPEDYCIAFAEIVKLKPDEPECQRHFQDLISKAGLMVSQITDYGPRYPYGEAGIVPPAFRHKYDTWPRDKFLVWNDGMRYQTPDEYKNRIEQAVNNASQGDERAMDQAFIRNLWLSGLVIQEGCGTGLMYPGGKAFGVPAPHYTGKPESYSPNSYVNWRILSPELLKERRIGCAAIRSKRGRVLGGLRHFSQDMQQTLRMRTDYEDFRGAFGNDQGFLDNYGIYLDRFDAYVVAEKAKQFLYKEHNHSGHRARELYSEMIY